MQKLILNRVKIKISKKPFKAKQVNIAAIQNNFFFGPSSQFFSFFSAVAYSAKTKIPGNKAPNINFLDFLA
jgi:hypothetical protein